jgi:hypothetical protein
MNQSRFGFSPKEEGVVDMEEVVVLVVLVIWVFPAPKKIDHYDQSNKIDF